MDSPEPYQGPRTSDTGAAVLGSDGEDKDHIGHDAERALSSPSSFSDSDSDSDTSWVTQAPPRPLRVVVAPFLDPPPSEQHAEWHKLRSFLYLLRFGSRESPHQVPAVVEALDRTQASVLDLLAEWWSGRPYDTALPAIKRHQFLLALSASDRETSCFHFNELKDLCFERDLAYLNDAGRMRQLSYDKDSCNGEQCVQSLERSKADMLESMEASYHKTMFNLYYIEIDPSAQWQDLDVDVAKVRNFASGRAALERIGLRALIQVSSFDNPSTACPPNLKVKDFPRPLPSIINPCHWLSSDEAVGLPHYLWDIKLRRTVETAGLRGPDIRYAIVSHRWGRLREGCAMESVRGVPWQVPKLTSYDVKQLPEVIMDAGFAEPYLWLDLFCIPQEMSVDWQARICKAELPRQLAIFRNSSTAAIWMNDVASWDNTAGAVAWLGLRFLKRSYEDSSVIYQGLCEAYDALETATRSESSRCDLMHRTEPVEEVAQRTMAPAWFTSLWTLQEIIIRPDMIMLDKQWRPLTVGNDLVITFDSLITLLNELSDIRDARTGVATLISGYEDHQMHLLARNTRFDCLILGAHRKSTSPRAPAVMSALGATRWFRGQTLRQFQSPEDADRLVLGLYPLDFVQEVRKLLGAPFFSCSNTVATLVMDEDTAEPAPGYPLRGTMLPFMPIPSGLLKSYVYPHKDHVGDFHDPTVRRWRVQLDGSVFLPRVAVIVSNTMVLKTPFQAKCWMESNDPEDTTSRHTVSRTFPLQEWICKFSGEAHAICTVFHYERMAGIILQRVKDSDSFVKAGTFDHDWAGRDDHAKIALPFRTVCDVGWHVL